MQPTDVDPGAMLAGRYRVVELLAETPGSNGVARMWRAVDEVLSRSVVVHVLAIDDPRTAPLLEAARRAATVTDVRFIRVLDATQDDGVAYVVREWVHGRNLATLLAEGPLPPRHAGLLIREAAEALANAHEQGLSHGRLDPDSLVITDTGAIKIVGLSTQAALTESQGGPDTDKARKDALGLGRLLYAALTARWPSGPRSGLGAGPRAADGSLMSPRQCRAGVPKLLDEITERILTDRPRHGAPLTSPQEIAAALTDAVGVTPPDGVLPPAGAGARDAGVDDATVAGLPMGADDSTQALFNGRRDNALASAGAANEVARADRTQADPRQNGAGRGGLPPGYAPPQRPPAQPYRRPGPRWTRIAIILVAAVFLIAVVLFAYQLARNAFETGNEGNGNGDNGNDPSTTPSATASAPGAGTKIAIAGGGSFDPQPKGSGDENPDKVPDAYDNKTDTAWFTKEYRDSRLDITKPGVGMWIDLGSAQDIGSVDLSLLGQGTTLELRAAPEDATAAPTELSGWSAPFGTESGAGGKVTIEPAEPVRSRFVLIWMTVLPPDGDNLRGGVSEVVVRR
ncbi:protein kinase family protein [Tenggerimyces flavus]|uniref:Protein kinase family protein n=1 Tax=Tenggerimyces flavus TaxID=1708749 RepID=A0ABV7YF71_9ACTN|nr:protein kinase family protein [Tenggerimyces flavus]MBM7784332.1 putative peptidoglycan lipid II flippase [Tenggerimyces flavus]